MMVLPNQIFRLRFRSGVTSAGLAPVAARQEHIITQTITRPFTTITALVTLGPADPTSTSSFPTTTTAEPTTATSSTSPSTVPVAGATNPSTSSSLTPTQLGAILGSVLGTAVLLLLLIWFYASMRRRAQQPRRVRMVSDDMESETSSETAAEMRMAGGAGYRRSAMAGAGDPWVRQGPTVVPPPPRFPPTPRFNPSMQFRHTRNPQIRGVKRYP